MSGGTFRSATRRVIMWGAAATLVYGGVAALKDSIGELAELILFQLFNSHLFCEIMFLFDE